MLSNGDLAKYIQKGDKIVLHHALILGGKDVTSQEWLLRNMKRVSKKGAPLLIRPMRVAIPLRHHPDCKEKRHPDKPE